MGPTTVQPALRLGTIGTNAIHWNGMVISYSNGHTPQTKIPVDYNLSSLNACEMQYCNNCTIPSWQDI
jgi:hypothetical protein